MIEFRQKLLRRRVAVKNQVRALLRGLGMVAVRGLWSGKGLAWLEAQELDAMDGVRRMMMLDELRESNRRIKQVEGELKKIADGHPGVALLRTIKGVGIRTAEAFAAYIDDVRRFRRVRQIGSYLGLVPCQDATGDVNHLGHITRDGPATLRKLLCEAAWQGVRRDPQTRAYFQRVMRGDPDRKKIALVATAHRLGRIMAAMLRTGEVYRKLANAAEVGGAPQVKEPAACAMGPSTSPLLADCTPALSRIRRDKGRRGKERGGKGRKGVATRGASSLTAPG